MPTTDATYMVRAQALRDDDHLDEEDLEVAGDHTITLPSEAATWSEAKQASAVLDIFHSSVPVGVLEDFEFSVIAPDGREIFEDN